jgi:hypothetical protein
MSGNEAADRLYFRQLLSGADFARDDPLARQMVNFVYLVGDRETGEAMVVDPAYGVGHDGRDQRPQLLQLGRAEWREREGGLV